MVWDSCLFLKNLLTSSKVFQSRFGFSQLVKVAKSPWLEALEQLLGF
jgi:hypothetical protein